MAIFLTEASKVIVQGMTGAEGQKHTTRMLASGTSVVGGVNPRKAGTSVSFGDTDVPVFGSVAEAMDATDTTTDDLREGQAVTFERGQGPKGPRGENVRVV